jgi:hypothetical protein
MTTSTGTMPTISMDILGNLTAILIHIQRCSMPILTTRTSIIATVINVMEYGLQLLLAKQAR